MFNCHVLHIAQVSQGSMQHGEYEPDCLDVLGLLDQPNHVIKQTMLVVAQGAGEVSEHSLLLL